uniref:Uncharacterized protein n=1 Tax=Anguilla anguilla TaxID=7936 RepID=A0A0E9W707_ANGAN
MSFLLFCFCVKCSQMIVPMYNTNFIHFAIYVSYKIINIIIMEETVWQSP